MPDRKSLISILWISASLALLVSVVGAPIRISGLASTSSRSDSEVRRHSLFPGQSSPCLRAASSSDDDVMEVDALASEIEEQDGADGLPEPRMTFLIPCSFRKVSDRQLIVPRSILSHYPLRC